MRERWDAAGADELGQAPGSPAVNRLSRLIAHQPPPHTSDLAQASRRCQATRKRTCSHAGHPGLAGLFGQQGHCSAGERIAGSTIAPGGVDASRLPRLLGRTFSSRAASWLSAEEAGPRYFKMPVMSHHFVESTHQGEV